MYGQWHALTQRLLKARDGSDVAPDDNWVHELNLDPQWRVPAGFGTKIIQENQERYMKAAWDQVGAVLEANKRIRAGQVARETSWVWYNEHLKPIKDRRKGQWLTLSAPLHARVLDRGMTVSHRIARSTVSAAVLSAPMRKVTRPRGRIARRLPFTADISPQNLIARLNQEEVSPAPPRVLAEVTNVREIAEVMLPDGLPVSIVDLLRKHRWLRWAPLALGLLVLLLLLLFSASLILIAAGAALAAGLAYLSWRLKTALTTIDQGDFVLDEHRTPEAVDQLPASPDFRISDPDEGFEPSIGTGPDSAEAVRYKKALKDGNLMLQQSAIAGAKPVRWPLDLPALADTIFARLDPRVTVPDWVRAGIRIPPADRRADRRGFRRGDDLSGVRPSDVQAARRSFRRTVNPKRQSDRRQQPHPARDQPTLYRSLYGRAQSRVREGAALARISDRPARKLFPAILGRLSFFGDGLSRAFASGFVTFRRFTNGPVRSSAITIHRQAAGEPQRIWCW